MNIQHGHARYWTTFVADNKDGFAGFRLHRESFGRVADVGQTTYWDATGGFAFATYAGEDVPVETVEAAIAEAREKIKTK